MPDSTPRCWQVVAKEIVEETNEQKIVELSAELIALDNQSGKPKQRNT